MKRKILVLMLALLVCLSLVLASCGDDEVVPTETTGVTPPTQGGTGTTQGSVINSGTTDTSDDTTDTSGDTTDTSVPGTDDSEPSTDSSVPGTDDSEPSTDSSVPGTDDSEPSTDSSDPGTDDSKDDPLPDDEPCTEHTGGVADCVNKAVCEKCGEPYGELGEHIEYEIEPGKAATCTEDGYTATIECENCGIDMATKEVIPATGHNYVDGVCTGCGSCVIGSGAVESITSSHTGGGAANADKLFDGEKATTGIYTVGDKEYSPVAVGDTLTITFKSEITTSKVIFWGAGNYTTSTVRFYDANGNQVKADKLLFNGGDGDLLSVNMVDGTEITFKTITIECTGLKWESGKTHKISEIEIYVDGCTEHAWTEATCTSPKGCAKCGAVEGEALGHTEAVLASKAPTCTEVGLTEGKGCSVCGTVFEAQTEIPATGHTERAEEGFAPTCTEAGLTDGVRCAICGEELVAQETIPATGHNEVTVSGKAPTCTETGLTDGKSCSVCGEVFEAQEEIDALGHTPEEVEEAEPTCTTEGMKNGTRCAVCKVVLEATETIPALGHNEAYEIIAPTCTEAGYTRVTCSRCDYVGTKDEVAATGHSFTIKGETTAPTCTEDGYTVYTCSVGGCGATANLDIVDSLGHDEIENVVSATCLAGGYTTVTCSRCDYTETKDETEKLGHVYDVVVETVVANCVAGGYTLYGCSSGECGTTEKRDETEIGDHNYVDGKCAGCGGFILGADAVESFTPSHEGGGAVAVDKLFDGDKTTTGIYGADGKEYYPTAANDSLTIVFKNEVTSDKVIFWGMGNYSHATVYFYNANGDQVKAVNVIYNDGDAYGGNSYAINVINGEEITFKSVKLVAGGLKWDNGKTEKTSEIEIYVDGCAEHAWSEATCTAAKTCTVCGVTEGNPLDHTAQAVEGTSPTCTEAGLTEGAVCSVCGTVITAQEEIPATGHSYGEWETVTEATCTTEGEQKKVCACGDTVTEKLPVIAHTEATIEAVPPTCTEAGYTAGIECSVCNTVITAPEAVEATGHSYEAGTCTVCGAEENITLSTGDNTVTVGANGTVRVVYTVGAGNGGKYNFSFKSSGSVTIYVEGSEDAISLNYSGVSIGAGESITFTIVSSDDASSLVEITVAKQEMGELPEEEI